MAVTIGCELFHSIWQIYGNILYFNQDTNPDVMKCKDLKNPGFEMIMLILLIFGYVFFIIYGVVIALVAALYCRRFTNRRATINKSNEVLKSISRIKFSEELFGALADENECIICMTPYGENDTITKLDCTGKHFYHT